MNAWVKGDTHIHMTAQTCTAQQSGRRVCVCACAVCGLYPWQAVSGPRVWSFLCKAEGSLLDTSIHQPASVCLHIWVSVCLRLWVHCACLHMFLTLESRQTIGYGANFGQGPHTHLYWPLIDSGHWDMMFMCWIRNKIKQVWLLKTAVELLSFPLPSVFPDTSVRRDKSLMYSLLKKHCVINVTSVQWSNVWRLFHSSISDMSCTVFVSAETSTPADTATPTLPADVETTTVPITTTGETRRQSAPHEGKKKMLG